MKPHKFATFRSHASITVILSVALISHFATPSASAAALTWSGGSNIWLDTVANGWNGNATWSNVNPDTGTFNGLGGTVTVQGPITTGAAALAFSAGNYTLQSNDPTVRVITLGNNNITLGNGVTTTIGAGVTLTRANLLVVDGNSKATSTLDIDSGGTLANTTASIATIKETTVNLNTGGIIQTGQFSIVLGDTADGATLNVLGGEVKLGSNPQAPNANNLVLGNGNTITSTVNLKITGGSISSTTAGLFGLRVGNATVGGTGVTTGIIDLEGGVTTVDQVFEGRANHSSTLNLHGGTLKARGNQADFVAVDNVWVKSGGAKFDSNGKAITVAKALLTDVSSTGGGLTLDDTAVIKGTLTLTGTNTYTGTTTVSTGTLKLGVNNCLPDTSAVSIAAATLDVGAFSDTAGTLDVTANAVINLGAGAALAFADSELVDWTGGMLNVTGTLGATSLRFGTDNTGLAPAQLALISVNGGGTGTYILDASGYLILGSGGPGPLDNFLISAISSPQTVGTPITGITLTARDSSNATVTSFTGTVNFGGTGGFSGTSATFTAGVLSGVSVIPTNAGSGLTFTVTDIGSGKTGSATITTIQTQFEAWAGGVLFDADTNNDGVQNGMAFLLGASGPNAAVTLPTVVQSGGSLQMTFSMLNAASRGAAAAELQHSSDLGISDSWISVLVPDTSGGTPSGVTFVITPGSPLNGVQATISSSESAGDKLFGRLKGVK